MTINRNLALLGFFIIILAFSINLNPISLQQTFADESQTEEIADLTNQQISQNKIIKMHLPFIKNIGQTDDAVKFYANTFLGTAFVTKESITYFLYDDIKSELKGVVLKERFLGDSLDPVGLEKSQSIVNYFVGEKENWKTSIPTYNVINLGSVWPGIDINLKARGNNFEKIFIISPHEIPDRIRIAVDGVASLEIDEEGRLKLNNINHSIHMTKPVAYQEIMGTKYYVDVSYILDGNSYGFVVGNYDPNHDLVIDPLLGSTYIGGGEFGTDRVTGIALDSSGNVYVTGLASDGFPTTEGAYDESLGNHFISKFNSDLTLLLSSTLWGSNISAVEPHIAIDSSDNVYVTGRTISNKFPVTEGAYDTTLNGSLDAFVSKFNSDLTILLASTLLGGSGSDVPNDIVIDSSDNVYITGSTASSNFPTTEGAYDTTFDTANDAFVSKFNSNLTVLLASTYLSGSSTDSASAVALDSSNNVYVGGITFSTDFPTTGEAYDTTSNGSFDAFVSKLSSDLTTLTASTYLGGTSIDDIRSIAIDSTNNVYVTGRAEQNFPTTVGAYDTTYGGNVDGHVSKFNSDLTTLLASTYLGGSGGETPRSITVDSASNVYVTGDAAANFPTTVGAYDTILDGGEDVFISKLNSDLTSLTASTYLGGSSFIESSYGIALDSTCNVYVAGLTFSSNFPTTFGAYDTTHNGDTDAFVSKFTNDLLLTDETSPTFTAIRTGLHTIELTFSENIDTTTVSGQGYSLSEGTVTANTDPGNCSNIMILSISGITGTSETPTVTYSISEGTTVDASGNEVSNGENTIALDGVPPIFTAARTSPTTWILTFSENVDAEAANENSAWSVSGGHTITEVADPENTNTLTITAADSTGTAGGQTITYVADSGTVTDASDNEVDDGTFAIATDAPCSAPLSGEWFITSSCSITGNIVAPGNVHVQNNALVTIENGGFLDIDFETKFLMVNSDSGVLVKSGGKVS